MSQSTLIYMFLESALDFWLFDPILNQIWERCWKTYFFIQGSPLWILSLFGLFWSFCPGVFWPYQGFILKLETSSFRQSVGLCYNKHTLDGRNYIQNIWFYHPTLFIIINHLFLIIHTIQLSSREWSELYFSYILRIKKIKLVDRFIITKSYCLVFPTRMEHVNCVF